MAINVNVEAALLVTTVTYLSTNVPRVHVRTRARVLTSLMGTFVNAKPDLKDRIAKKSMITATKGPVTMAVFAPAALSGIIANAQLDILVHDVKRTSTNAFKGNVINMARVGASTPLAVMLASARMASSAKAVRLIKTIASRTHARTLGTA